MKLEKGCIVTFKSRGVQYKGGMVQKEVTGKCLKIAPEGVYVSTGMALWLTPVTSITNVRPAKVPPMPSKDAANAVGAA